LGEDRWIAISNFTEEQWRATVEVLGKPSWASATRFAGLESRRNQDELDALANQETVNSERYELMYALQARGVRAGVVQDAQDRVELDQQLKSLGWRVELEQTDHGT
jgi:crotonobetainyl-CoA:carnitine CoA-transferase CaiB-like acyl-CoA transferase